MNMPRGKSTRLRNDISSVENFRTTVKSISRSVDVLICLGKGINTVTEIAKRCQLSKSTAHRLLKALEESNLAIRDSINHRYYMGYLITQRASNPQTTHEYLINSAMDEMRHLADTTEETVALRIMLGIQYVQLHEIQSKHNLLVTDSVRQVGPPFSGALATVLLSQLDDKLLVAAMRNLRGTRETERPVVDMELLMAQLKKIRQEGYAVSYGDRVAGAIAVSAPIKNYICPAALGIMGPENRLKAKIPALIDEIKVSADRISADIAEIYGKVGREI
jgi:IclR family KDG regulon transcriptional repressor